MFENQTQSNLRLGAQLGPDALPGWAWSIIREMDDQLPVRVKEDLRGTVAGPVGTGVGAAIAPRLTAAS